MTHEAETDLILYGLLKRYTSGQVASGSKEERELLDLIADRYLDFGMEDHAAFFRAETGSVEETRAAGKVFKEGQSLMELLPLPREVLAPPPEQQWEEFEMNRKIGGGRP
jgi:hypothetical protein